MRLKSYITALDRFRVIYGNLLKIGRLNTFDPDKDIREPMDKPHYYAGKISINTTKEPKRADVTLSQFLNELNEIYTYIGNVEVDGNKPRMYWPDKDPYGPKDKFLEL